MTDLSTNPRPASVDDPSEPPPEPSTTNPWHAPNLGTVLQGLAVTGVVVTLIATTVGWVFLSDLDRNLDRSLTIGEDAAATLSDTIDVADDIVDTTDQSLATLASSLDTVSGIAGTTSGVASSTASLAARLPESFAEVDDALATVESLSGTVDEALRSASRLPIGPDYDPDVPFPDAIAEVRRSLEPIEADLESIADDLAGFENRAGEFDEDLRAVADNVDDARQALSDSDALLDRYRSSSEEARQLARSSREDFDRSLTLARGATLLLGAFLAAFQIVPWTLGRRLRIA